MTMSFFDQRYYAINKGLMSRIGIWPEQTACVRNTLPLTIVAIILSIGGPQGDLDAVINGLPTLLCIIVNCTTILNSIQKTGKMKVMLKKMESHWEMFKNTSAVMVLDKYAERGRFLTTAYSVYIYISLVFFLFMPIVPMILDFVYPLNETRPKDYLYEAEYGVDPDKYFWPILAHGYIVTAVGVSIFVAIDTMYIMWVEHACALFEIVGFKLKTTAAEYMIDKTKTVITHNDSSYKKMCDCIILHKEAISFAGMIESVYSGSLLVVIGISTIIMSVTGLQAVINIKHPEVLLRVSSFVFGQAFHLWFNNLPGQKLIDHSSRVHNFAYDFNWYDMPIKTRKLLLAILIRSQIPCLLTAGKVYVLSMESFGSVMQTAMSYFLIFMQLY